MRQLAAACGCENQRHAASERLENAGASLRDYNHTPFDDGTVARLLEEQVEAMDEARLGLLGLPWACLGLARWASAGDFAAAPVKSQSEIHPKSATVPGDDACGGRRGRFLSEPSFELLK